MKKNGYVAYLGKPGSYSYLASLQYFKDKDYVGKKTFKEIFLAVNEKEADFGVIPLENSLTGAIMENYDLLTSANLFIAGEIIMKINHVLLTRKGVTNILNITGCFSHPEAFKQCQTFFDSNKKIEIIFTKDTAEAALLLKKENNPNYCAIASKDSARIYHLNIIREDIGDNPNNYTRFGVIAKKKKKKGNKMSIIFTVEHKPGSLLKTLRPYAKYGLNLTKIESRPVMGKPWEYIFLVDFEIGGKANMIQNVLSEMKKNVNFLKVVGIYNKAKTYET